MANEKFRVKFGLQVGDTTADINATTGDIATIGQAIIANGTTGQVTVGGSTQGKLEIGLQNRATAGTPYLDFHSSATAADYDVRLLVSGGNATNGNGDLTITANSVTTSEDLTVTGNLAVNGGAITSTAADATVFNGVSTINTLSMGGYTGVINVGGTDDGSTVNIGAGATLSARTKTINLGTAGVSGSTTNVNIGSSVTGALGTTTVNSGATLTLAPGASTTTTNIGPTTTGSSVVVGANRLTSPTIFNFTPGTVTYRGLLINNATSGAYAASRNGLVMRTVPTGAAGPRGGLVFENGRTNSSGVLAALQGPSTTQVGDYLGEILAGGYATDRYITEAVATTAMAFTPYATETWVNSGTTVSASGTGWALQLQPTATNLSTTSKVTTVDTTPQNLSLRSDLVGISKGKTTTFSASGCSTSGTTLTIGTLLTGTVSVGSMIQNSTNLLPAGTYIVANISGSGSGSTWTLNQSQPTYTSSLVVAGYQGYLSMTGTGDVDVIGDLTVRGNDIKSSTGTTQIVTSASGSTLELRGNNIQLEDAAGTSIKGGNITYRRTFGCFHKVANVTAAAANTVYNFDWYTDTTVHVGNQGVTVTSGQPTRVNIDAAGSYTAFVEMQVKNTVSANRVAWIWLAKNGTDLTETRIKVEIKQGGGTDAYQLINKLWLLDSIAANDYVEVRFAVDNNTGISLEYEAAQTSPFVMPAQPSATITIVPVGA